jgi:hypothetical protein
MRELFIDWGYRTTKVQWTDHWDIFNLHSCRTCTALGVGSRNRLGLVADPATNFSSAHGIAKNVFT